MENMTSQKAQHILCDMSLEEDIDGIYTYSEEENTALWMAQKALEICEKKGFLSYQDFHDHFKKVSKMEKTKPNLALIAIKDFEFPKDCDSCTFYDYHNDAEDDYRITGEILSRVKVGERHEKCPLMVLEQAEKIGHWIDLNENNCGHCDDNGSSYVKCSECDTCNGTDESEYCPNCGAKMIHRLIK